MARKKDCGSVENGVVTHHNPTGVKNGPRAPVEENDTFRQQLEKMGLAIRDMPGDGNCLFRALGDQLDGHYRNHLKYRLETTQYMLEHRKDFEPFVEDDIPFDRYLRQLRQSGTYAGNDVIVAFSRLHSLNVIIHQMNTPPWVIQGTDEADGRQLHISYSNGDHYSSLRRVGDNKPVPANIKLKCMYVACDAKAGKKCRSPTTSSMSSVTYDDVDPVISELALHDDDYDSIVECVTAATECTDRQLISDMLLSTNNDVEKTIEALMTIMYNVDCLDDVSVDTSQGRELGARPKDSTQTSTTKAERKVNKRERASARHKEKLAAINNVVVNVNNNASPSNQRNNIGCDSDGEETIVNSMTSVQI